MHAPRARTFGRGTVLRALPLAVALLGTAAWRTGRPVLPAPTPSPALLVLSKGEHTLSIVDPGSRAVVGRIPAGADPHEVVASTDGQTAYISNYGGGTDHTITAVDLVGQRPLQVIDLGVLRGPHGLEFVDGVLWFTAEGANAVGRYDPATGQVDQVLGTGQHRTHMLAVSPDGKRIVTTNVSSGTVSVIEQRTDAPAGGSPHVEWQQTVISVGPGAEGLDVAPDGREAWVANAGDGTISVIDLAAKRVVQTLAVEVRGANRLKFTPDGSLVFVSTLGGPDVTVLRAATRAVVTRVPVGHGAAGIQMQPDGRRVYVACTPDSYVAVIDVPSLAVVGRITAGREPDGMAWAVRR